jgi:hypothetical protein
MPVYSTRFRSVSSGGFCDDSDIHSLPAGANCFPVALSATSLRLCDVQLLASCVAVGYAVSWLDYFLEECVPLRTQAGEWRPCCGPFPQWIPAPVLVAPSTSTETHPAYKKEKQFESWGGSCWPSADAVLQAIQGPATPLTDRTNKAIRPTR